MTKTTNFEISKKLKEIGFKAEAEFFFYLDKPDYGAWHISEEGQIFANEKDDCLPSYDLETLLEFAFNKIDDFIICEDRVFIGDHAEQYDTWNGHWKITDNLLVERDRFYTRDNEKNTIITFSCNYAELVAKLIILLHEKNLIEF
jgi:hypothetical protein